MFALAYREGTQPHILFKKVVQNYVICKKFASVPQLKSVFVIMEFLIFQTRLFLHYL